MYIQYLRYNQKLDIWELNSVCYTIGIPKDIPKEDQLGFDVEFAMEEMNKRNAELRQRRNHA